MLLLVPAQKTTEDGGPTTNSQQPNSSSPSNFSSTTVTTTHSSAPSNSGPISNSSARVLVVLPSHTDLTSKLTVSDSSVLTTSFLNHSLSSPYSEHHNDSREHEQLMGYSGRRRSNGNNIYDGFYSGMVRSSDPEFDNNMVTGYTDRQQQHRRHSVQAGSMAESSASYYSPPSSSSTSTPFSSNSPLSQHLSFADSPFTDNFSRRRHSHLGLALGGSSGSSGMDLDTIARLRHSSNSPATASNYTNRRSRSRPSRRASTFTTTSVSIPTAKSAKMAMASARHATRSFREAFKKSMTVHSPLLTSTSSGMVLDLSPGPEPNIVSSKLRVGGEGEVRRDVSGSGGGGATEDMSRAGETGAGLALSADRKQHYHLQAPSARKRSQDDMMKDLYRDGNVGVCVGGVNSEPMDTASDSSNSRPNSPTVYRKQQKKSDSNSGRGFGARATSNGLSALLDVDADSPSQSKKTAVPRWQSSSSLATTSVSRPVSAPSSSASRSQSPRGPSSRSSSSSSPTFAMPSPSLTSPAPAPVKEDHRMREDDEGVEGEEENDYHTLKQEQEQQDPMNRVVTTQDISAITASMGALTPLEIQRRLYAHQEKQQKLRKRRLLLHHHHQQQQQLQQQQQQQHQQQFLRESTGTGISHHFPNFHPLSMATGDSSQIQTPTTQQQYRGIVRGYHNGTVDPISRKTPVTMANTRTTTMNMTSPYQQQSYPPYLYSRHPQSHQAQPQTQGPPLVQRPSPLSTSAATATSASMSHPSHPLYQHKHQHRYHPQHQHQHQQQQQQQQHQQQQLPSCYYLPPSAFRTASAVAAEEQLEAERKRKELLHLAATATNIDGEEQINERMTDQELEEEKKKNKVEVEVGEEFLIFPSPNLP